MLACGLLAGSWPSMAADDTAGGEKPAFERALPARMFACTENAQCMVVQGWCASFAINKTELAAYDRIPADPQGKAARGCPPGWLPPLPEAVCVAKRCAVVSGRPVAVPASPGGTP